MLYEPTTRNKNREETYNVIIIVQYMYQVYLCMEKNL